MSSDDVLLIFNNKRLFPCVKNNANYKKDFSNYYLAECFWVAQFSLLVKENHLIGIAYYLDEPYFEVVSTWVNHWKSPYMQLKDINKTIYYKGGYLTQYVIEIYFILDEPDRYVGLGMIEDCWWYLQDNIRDQHGWYMECIQPEIAIPNLYAIGLSNPTEIAKEWDLIWDPKRIKF